MASTWTTEQVLALAPDPASAKAGQGLASPRKWVTLGQDDKSAWGECQGSAKLPYQASIDLSEPAFKCTCPSRKFPCKHSLGLFLILAGQPAAVKTSAAPAWVGEWLSGRSQRAEKKAAKAERGPAPVDPVAQQKRAAEREATVASGLKDLDLWLRDIVRQGLASVQTRPERFWETTAARMVDAQAPGVARLVRQMSGIPATGKEWPDRLLGALGRLHLLREGFSRIDTLPTPVQADVRATIGWTKKQEELFGEKSERDTWLIVGQRVEEEDRLRAQRAWLVGRDSGRAALLLSFSHLSQPRDASLVTGTTFEADLVFYPGAFPLRAVVKERHGTPGRVAGFKGYGNFTEAYAAYATALGANPWLERFPMALENVLPAPSGQSWILRDQSGNALPLVPRLECSWELLALGGGNSMTVFGEWDGEYLLPLSVWAEERFWAFNQSQNV
jgi:hypothetical protein